MGMAPLYSASASPGPSPAMRRVGTPTICQAGEFSIERCNPALARMSWSWRGLTPCVVTVIRTKLSLGSYHSSLSTNGWHNPNLLIDDHGSLRVRSELPPKFCFDHLFAGVPGGRADVRAARHIGPCFDLEHVTSNVGGTGHASPLSAAVALWHVRDQHVTLRGPRFACCPLWLHTLGNSVVEPLRR